jgi:pimeloyl-ACP methyl ester carboxylesterase
MWLRTRLTQTKRSADYAVGQMFDMPAVWAEMCENLKTASISKCGHLPQEEQHETVNNQLSDFLKGWAI